MTPGHLPRSPGDALFCFYFPVICSPPGLRGRGRGAALPKHEAGPRTGSRGSQRKVWDLPAGDGEKKAGRSRQASQGCLCPGAAVTDCHKPASHRVDLLSYSSGARVLNSGRQSCVPSGGSRKESLSLPFLASTGCLRSLARGPFLQITSLSPSVSLSLSRSISLSLSPAPPQAAMRNPIGCVT